MTLTVIVPLPPARLSANGSAHWAKKAKSKSKYRMDCRLAAIDVINRTLPKPPRWERASVAITFYRRRSNATCVIDQDNAVTWLKACWDGFQDAGIVANDRGLTFEPVRFELDKQNPRVEITVTESPTPSRTENP